MKKSEKDYAIKDAYSNIFFIGALLFMMVLWQFNEGFSLVLALFFCLLGFFLGAIIYQVTHQREVFGEPED